MRHKTTKKSFYGGDETPLDVGAIVNGLITISLNITMMITVFLLITIIVVTIVNFIILAVVGGIDAQGYDSDTIYKDTLKYKLLRYIDYINSKLQKKNNNDDDSAQTTQTSSMFAYSSQPAAQTASQTNQLQSGPPGQSFFVSQQTSTTQSKPEPPEISEPYFFIYNGTVPMLSMIYLCYVFLLIICILAFIIYIIFAYFVKIIYKDFNVEMKGSFNISALPLLPIIFGIVVAVILGIFHWLYVDKVIKPSLAKIKNAIYQIDYTINRELTKTDEKFNTDLATLLSKKSKDEDLSKYKEYIQRDIAANQLDKAKQKIILIILYSHLHDQIPYTNMRAIKLINYYFFKNPASTANDLDIRDPDELNDLTFVSLLIASKGITLVDPKYITKDFYDSPSLDPNRVNEVSEAVTAFFTDLNGQLQSFPSFTHPLGLFAGYFVVFLVLSIILVFIFLASISKSKGMLNSSITSMAGAVYNLMSRIKPLNVLDNLTNKLGSNDANPTTNEATNTTTNPEQIMNKQYRI